MPNLNPTNCINKIDNLSKKTKDLIYDLRINKNYSYPRISKEVDLCPQMIYKYCKKYLDMTYNPDLVTRQQKAMLGNKFSRKYLEKDIKLLIDDLYNFAVNSHNIMIGRFLYRNYGKTSNWLDQLKIQYPFIESELNNIKKLIAEKIRDKSIQGKYNVSFAKDVIEELDAEYLKLQQERASRSKPEETKESSLNVNITSYKDEEVKSEE